MEFSVGEIGGVHLRFFLEFWGAGGHGGVLACLDWTPLGGAHFRICGFVETGNWVESVTERIGKG